MITAVYGGQIITDVKKSFGVNSKGMDLSALERT